MKKLISLVLFSSLVSCLTAADKKEEKKKISKPEQAIRAGKDIQKVNPNAAKPGEKPNEYGNPGHQHPHPEHPPHPPHPEKPVKP